MDDLSNVFDKIQEVDLQKTMDPARYTGRSTIQVEQFLEKVVKPILEENKDLLGVKADITV